MDHATKMSKKRVRYKLSFRTIYIYRAAASRSDVSGPKQLGGGNHVQEKVQLRLVSCFLELQNLFRSRTVSQKIKSTLYGTYGYQSLHTVLRHGPWRRKMNKTWWCSNTESGGERTNELDTLVYKIKDRYSNRDRMVHVHWMDGLLTLRKRAPHKTRRRGKQRDWQSLEK